VFEGSTGTHIDTTGLQPGVAKIVTAVLFQTSANK